MGIKAISKSLFSMHIIYDFFPQLLDTMRSDIKFDVCISDICVNQVEYSVQYY